MEVKESLSLERRTFPPGYKDCMAALIAWTFASVSFASFAEGL